MKQERNNLNLLDLITIISFFIGLYALDIALLNLKENEEQSKNQEDLLKYLEQHLSSQDLHLKEQDEILKNLTK